MSSTPLRRIEQIKDAFTLPTEKRGAVRYGQRIADEKTRQIGREALVDADAQQRKAEGDAAAEQKRVMPALLVP